MSALGQKRTYTVQQGMSAIDVDGDRGQALHRVCTRVIRYIVLFVPVSAVLRSKGDISGAQP